MYTLVNLFLPNSNQVNVLETLLDKMIPHVKGVLILTGDFNIVLDPLLDTYKGTSHLSHQILRKAKEMLHNLRLVGSWKSVHPAD